MFVRSSRHGRRDINLFFPKAEVSGEGDREHVLELLSSFFPLVSVIRDATRRVVIERTLLRLEADDAMIVLSYRIVKIVVSPRPGSFSITYPWHRKEQIDLVREELDDYLTVLEDTVGDPARTARGTLSKLLDSLKKSDISWSYLLGAESPFVSAPLRIYEYVFKRDRDLERLLGASRAYRLGHGESSLVNIAVQDVAQVLGGVLDEAPIVETSATSAVLLYPRCGICTHIFLETARDVVVSLRLSSQPGRDSMERTYSIGSWWSRRLGYLVHVTIPDTVRRDLLDLWLAAIQSLIGEIPQRVADMLCISSVKQY